MKNKEIMLSIIVPAYNHEKYIGQAIERILSQNTSYAYEILIGDDCSTDNTKDIIEEYYKIYPNKIRYFSYKKNIGATRNGYYLMKHAKGKYFAFCDGDDRWSDDGRIERDISFLEENPHLSGVCGKVALMDEEGRAIEDIEIADKDRFWKQDNAIYDMGLFQKWEMPGHISALTIRNFMRVMPEDYRSFYKIHPMVGDRTLLFFALLYGNILCTSQVVSCYRYRTDQSNNFMSDYKKKNMYGADFLMMRKLEWYASNFYNRQLDLSGIKKQRLIAAVVRAMKTKDKSDWKIVVEIVRKSGSPVQYAYYICKIVILKIIQWKIYKCDRRIIL